MTAPTVRNMPGHLVGDRYMLLSLIAKGGMGEVWKARDQRTGKIVAAKVLRPELSGEELPLNRLRLEAHNTLLIEHPNIAAVYDSGEEDGRGWLVMELIEGRPLTDYLRNGNRIAPAELLPVLIQMSMALGAAAQAGVVHRDIKPANILIRPNGIVKITDFGISRTAHQVDLTQAGMVMGTAQYLPPEQALGELATSVGDLYSVGVIAYEACSGKRPFTGKSQVDIAFAHVHEQLPPLPEDVPTELANVIYHLLEKNPADRPQSGKELTTELVAVAKALGLPITATPLTLPLSPDGQPAPAVTRAQPVVPPVRHTPVRTLPDDMLSRPNLDDATLDTLVPPREIATPELSRRTLSHETTQGASPTPDPTEGGTPNATHHARGGARRAHFRPVDAAAMASDTTPAGRQTPPAQPANATQTRGVSPAPRATWATTPTRRAMVASKVHWHGVNPYTATAPQQTPPRAARTRYSRSVVAPQGKARARKVGWAFGIAFALTVFLIMLLLVYIFFRSYLPLPVAEGQSTHVNPTPSVTLWGSPSSQEAHHV